jgi:hypothetical protein
MLILLKRSQIRPSDLFNSELVLKQNSFGHFVGSTDVGLAHHDPSVSLRDSEFKLNMIFCCKITSKTDSLRTNVRMIAR